MRLCFCQTLSLSLCVVLTCTLCLQPCQTFCQIWWKWHDFEVIQFIHSIVCWHCGMPDVSAFLCDFMLTNNFACINNVTLLSLNHSMCAMHQFHLVMVSILFTLVLIRFFCPNLSVLGAFIQSVLNVAVLLQPQSALAKAVNVSLNWNVSGYTSTLHATLPN